jgi:hypothetical protein
LERLVIGDQRLDSINRGNKYNAICSKSKVTISHPDEDRILEMF